MGWGEVAGAVAGDLISADVNYQNTRGLMSKSQGWQEYMSNTAYQRSMRDMQAAGLNPILAYSQGGASTPGGSGPSSGTADIDISGALSSAKQMEQRDKEMEKINAEIETQKEQAQVLRTEGAKNLAQADSISQSTAESRARTSRTLAEVPKVGAETERIGRESEKLLSETKSASAKAWQDTQDVARREKFGPKSVYTDMAESIDRVSQSIIARWRKWLGVSGESPKEAAMKRSHGASGDW